MLLELFQVFSISVPFQEMKAPDLVQLEAQSQRDSAVKSASFSSAVHKNSHQVFIHSRVPLLSNTDNKSLCKDLNIFRKIGCYRSQQLTQHPTCMNPPPCIPPPQPEYQLLGWVFGRNNRNTDCVTVQPTLVGKITFGCMTQHAQARHGDWGKGKQGQDLKGELRGHDAAFWFGEKEAEHHDSTDKLTHLQTSYNSFKHTCSSSQ